MIRRSSSKEKAYDDAGEVMDNEEVSEEETQKPRSSGRKIAIFLILVILIAGGFICGLRPGNKDDFELRFCHGWNKFSG